MEAEKELAELKTRIREIAYRHNEDYPYTQHTSWEHLWAIDEGAKGISMANEDCHEVIQRMKEEAASVLILMDQLAEQWGDEGVFRRCRDRLRVVATAPWKFSSAGIAP